MGYQENYSFELPGKLERIFASLSVYYGKTGKPHLQRLLVNSRYSVQEETSYDNWNGGTYGHDIRFQVPPSIYFEVFDNLSEIQQELKQDINRLANVDNEFIDDAVLELQEDQWLDDWRENSGLLLHNTPLKVPTSDDDLARIWRKGFLRLFISHKSEYKSETSDIKAKLLNYGISSFVAHEDIEPTKEWQDEIERALFSMHVMVPLLTDRFHNSMWTDQEIGVAIGRGVTIVPVRLGTDPYGFIGKYQGLAGGNKTCFRLAAELVNILFGMPELQDVIKEALVTRFETAESYEQANTVIKIMDERFKALSPNFIERLESAPKNNSQVRDAFDVKSKLPALLRQLKGKSA